MSEDDKPANLQIGIVMGELKAGMDRLQRQGDRSEANHVHVLGALSTLTAKVADIETRVDAYEARPRMSSVTTEHMVAKVVEEANERQSEKNSESMRVAQMAAIKPLEEATAKQTEVVQSVVADQTKTLTRANTVGYIIMGVVLGALQLLQHFLQH